jgi:cysteine desulfuration protein SufE
MNIEELAETFELLGDWEERYRYLIDLGRKLEPMPEADKTEATKVRGCMSQVWMTARAEGERLHFQGDSDAHLVRGLIALLFLLVQDRTRAEILETDIKDAFTRLGFENHITMNRRNGFYAMVERIRQLAAGAPA